MCVCVYSCLLKFGAKGGWKSRKRGMGLRGKGERRGEWGGGVQVLLMDPGTELGWAVLSDTLPSGGDRDRISDTRHTKHISSPSGHCF